MWTRHNRNAISTSAGGSGWRNTASTRSDAWSTNLNKCLQRRSWSVVPTRPSTFSHTALGFGLSCVSLALRDLSGITSQWGELFFCWSWTGRFQGPREIKKSHPSPRKMINPSTGSCWVINKSSVTSEKSRLEMSWKATEALFRHHDPTRRMPVAPGGLSLPTTGQHKGVFFPSGGGQFSIHLLSMGLNKPSPSPLPLLSKFVSRPRLLTSKYSQVSRVHSTIAVSPQHEGISS